MTSAFDAEVIFFCKRKGSNTMASSKRYHFCLIDKFIQKIQKRFQYYLEIGQQLIDIHLCPHIERAPPL